MDHAINITQDGILKIRIPEGFRIDKVQVEEIGTEKRQLFCEKMQLSQEDATIPNTSNVLEALDLISKKAAVDAIKELQLPIMRSDFEHEQWIFQGLSNALNAIEELPTVLRWRW